jgi:hypothetical protein
MFVLTVQKCAVSDYFSDFVLRCVYSNQVGRHVNQWERKWGGRFYKTDIHLITTTAVVDQPGLARIDATAGVDPACPGLLRLTDPTSPCLRPTTVFLDGLGWKGQSQLAPSTHESYVDQAPPRPSQQAMFHPTLSPCLNLASLDQASLNWMGPPQPPQLL